MIQVRFFARVREALGEDSLQLAHSAEVASLDALHEHLCQRGAKWREVLSEVNLLRAVNHDVVHGDQALVAGDEVAFYPPVTGG
ncbi:molybdopterin converting factor subunit 1 [Parahaliea sp. F7430]|uniref:Molybdopterin synthase sulfur carrier subunit n=1 Tax=Sediminihaliea albiluteola TaxID=2758564 RepID=A0A7W2YIQ1_9GAMM|nr:molybdopterin converting factor subunit 1 [Sediminihaliea albiluteola]MBA6412355.1 molybdopterin converting factor subunit 1 [Sediminihaliea albiluteola]